MEWILITTEYLVKREKQFFLRHTPHAYVNKYENNKKKKEKKIRDLQEQENHIKEKEVNDVELNETRHVK